jgi:hypothetical protein
VGGLGIGIAACAAPKALTAAMSSARPKRNERNIVNDSQAAGLAKPAILTKLTAADRRGRDKAETL